MKSELLSKNFSSRKLKSTTMMREDSSDEIRDADHYEYSVMHQH
jgi:hypothetical protein